MKRTLKITVLVIVLILLFIAMGLCGYLLYQESQKPDVMDQYDYEEIQTLVETAPAQNEEAKEINAPVVQYDPDALKATNNDFLGWLYIPDSYINLPVTTGSDNDWYLDHSFTREYSVFGCPFLDVNTPVGSRNRVVHGHNMGSKRTEMFSRLLDYQDSEYAKAHKTLYFSEPDREGEEYEIFAVLNFDLSLLDECNYIQADFDTEEDFSAFISYLKNKSLYETSFTPEGETLILSTCNRSFGEDNRLLICAGKLHANDPSEH